MTDHEKAAFKGAASVKKTEPTHDEIMQQPWKYPQGRIPPEEYKDEPVAFWLVLVAIIALLMIGIGGLLW
jgi:hypothetical protein